MLFNVTARIIAMARPATANAMPNSISELSAPVSRTERAIFSGALLRTPQSGTREGTSIFDDRRIRPIGNCDFDPALADAAAVAPANDTLFGPERKLRPSWRPISSVPSASPTRSRRSSPGPGRDDAEHRVVGSVDPDADRVPGVQGSGMVGDQRIEDGTGRPSHEGDRPVCRDDRPAYGGATRRSEDQCGKRRRSGLRWHCGGRA